MNDDLISREDLKTGLHNFFDGKVIDEPNYILRDVFCFIDNAPTITPTFQLKDITDEDVARFAMIWQRATSKGLILEPERPHGKWIYVCCFGDEFPQCSVCGKINDVKSRFCPDCGADMRKESDE